MSSDTSDADRSPTATDRATDPTVDSARIRRRLRRRAARVGRREAEEALSKLEASGELTDDQRRTVELLGATLARRLTAVPEPALERDERDDDALALTLSRLFDVEDEDRPDTGGDRS